MTERSPDAVEPTAGWVDDAVDDPADDPVDARGPSQDQEPPQSRRTETGHPAVDEVLRSLDRLDDAPVEEHPHVFERAHETLRSALSEARESGPSGDA